MDRIDAIEQRRREILQEMGAIRSLCPASLKEQMLPVRHKGRKEPVMRGPYYVLARWEDGKTRSRRVKRAQVDQVKQDVDNHKRFRALCKEFEELTEQLGVLERQAGLVDEDVKKKPKSTSSAARKPSG